MQEYLLRIVSAGLICASVGRLLENKGAASALGKLLSGLLLVFTVISPLAQLTPGTLDMGWSQLQQEASIAAITGQESAAQALRDGIKQRTEAYIWDKALSLGSELEVEVILSDDTIPLPCGVRLSGDIAPYARQQLEAMLRQELAVTKEAIQWI